MSKYTRSDMTIETHVPQELITYFSDRGVWDNDRLEKFFEEGLRKNGLMCATNHGTQKWAEAHKGHIASIIERLGLSSEPLTKPKEQKNCLI